MWFRWLILGLPLAAWAEPPTCPVDDGSVAPTTRQLRAASLSLRGIVPDASEYEQVLSDGFEDGLIDEWLATDAFAEQVSRHHRSLFWNNVQNVDLIDNDSRIRPTDGIYFVDDSPAEVRRGVNDAHCGNFDASFDTDGRPITVEGPEGSRQEGWVWVTPFWAPDTTVKVCAFDAQERRFTGSGTDCATEDWEDDPDCGCGPNLIWCGNNNVENAINDGFARDIDLRVERIIREDRSYLDLFEDTTGYVNGPMVHYYRHGTGKPDDILFAPGQVDLARLPDLAFTDVDTYVPVDLGVQHAGVMTSPAWLMRFMTNRARASRFYESFLCQPFQPPDGGLTDLDDPNPSLDLTERPGCQYCHALLEPAAAHWGRWPEAGAGYLDPNEYPAFSPECETCATNGTACSSECRNLYVVDPIASEQYDFIGWLNAYQFLETRHMSHVEQGPNQLVRSTVADGRLPTCVAKRTAEWLMGRDMTPADQEWLDTLADDFVGSDFRYRSLVRDIITSDNYRRVR